LFGWFGLRITRSGLVVGAVVVAVVIGDVVVIEVVVVVVFVVVDVFIVFKSSPNKKLFPLLRPQSEKPLQ
jgi:hypothetical protein